MKTKVRYWTDRLKEDLKDPEFRKHYEKEKRTVRVAYEIVKLRHRLGLSQAELAGRVGTTQQVISRLESGSYTGYTLKTLERLARATGTELIIGFRPVRRKQVVGSRRSRLRRIRPPKRWRIFNLRRTLACVRVAT